MRFLPAALAALSLTAPVALADTPMLECLSDSHYATVSETDRPGRYALHLMGVEGDMDAQVQPLVAGLSIASTPSPDQLALAVILNHDGSAAISVQPPEGPHRIEAAECIGQQSFLDGYGG